MSEMRVAFMVFLISSLRTHVVPFKNVVDPFKNDFDDCHE
jgi:hypothetical protein